MSDPTHYVTVRVGQPNRYWGWRRSKGGADVLVSPATGRPTEDDARLDCKLEATLAAKSTGRPQTCNVRSELTAATDL